MTFGRIKRRWARGVRLIEEFRQDLGYGARLLAKNRGVTLIAVLTLAAGVGANTAIFSVVNAFLLRPLPYAEPERLIMVDSQYRGQSTGVSFVDYEDCASRIMFLRTWRFSICVGTQIYNLAPAGRNRTGRGRSCRQQ